MGVRKMFTAGQTIGKLRQGEVLMEGVELLTVTE